MYNKVLYVYLYTIYWCVRSDSTYEIQRAIRTENVNIEHEKRQKQFILLSRAGEKTAEGNETQQPKDCSMKVLLQNNIIRYARNDITLQHTHTHT